MGGGCGGWNWDWIFFNRKLEVFFFSFLRRRWGGFGYVGGNGKFFFLETVGSFFCDKHCGEFSLIGFLLFLFLIFINLLF